MEKKSKGLSAWQLTMMALGSVIGGSFFLGSSVAIQAAGPSILLSYILGGALVYFILFALSEMTVANPTTGSFSTFAAQELGIGAGFVVGWLYWTGMVLSMSSEATAISILVREWFPNVSIAWLGSAIIIGVTLLNLLGADKLGKLESALSGVKIFAIIFFILTAIVLIFGVIPGTSPIGTGEVANEPLMPGGIKGIAGSMLLIIFAYAGFEIIGLAASEAENPRETVPKAIRYTVFSLVGLYIIYATALLPLIPTASLNENISPMVASLDRWGIGWAGTAINLVLISAILSTMLAAIFGLGRMIRSLTDEGHAPKWLKDKRDVPYRGILFSGLAMLLGLGFWSLVSKSIFGFNLYRRLRLTFYLRRYYGQSYKISQKERMSSRRKVSNAWVSVYVLDCFNKHDYYTFEYALNTWTGSRAYRGYCYGCNPFNQLSSYKIYEKNSNRI